MIFATLFDKSLRTSLCALSVNKHKQNNANNILAQHDYFRCLFLSHLSVPSESLLLTQTGYRNDADADADAYLNVKSLYLVRICLETDMVV